MYCEAGKNPGKRLANEHHVFYTGILIKIDMSCDSSCSGDQLSQSVTNQASCDLKKTHKNNSPMKIQLGITTYTHIFFKSDLGPFISSSWDFFENMGAVIKIKTTNSSKVNSQSLVCLSFHSVQ